ncbi:MAG TPA: selenide, water dikinase SelD, partial [bacterium]|nr:selenide, water dikinase SelD [bacterium]
MLPIYLDYNATTPIDPEVAAAMLPCLVTAFGNPSSTHWYGVQAKAAVEQARREVAGLIGAYADEILFTSGGSEANNLAIKGYCLAHRERGRHLIISAVEHPAVVEVAAHLASLGFEVTTLPVDAQAMVDPAALAAALREDTLLVSVMHANNEVGTIEPIAALAALAHARGALFHCDAAQSAGKIAVDVAALGVDLLSIAGHKLYAPKGVGALYLRRGVVLEKQIHGAGHEHDLRAGTENVLEIAGLGAACRIAARDLDAVTARLAGLRDRLYEGLAARLDGIHRNGHPQALLPNTLSISFHRIEANALLARLEEVAASAGAACHSEAITISPVLAAMGVPLEWAMGTIRFSVGRMTTTEEIDRAIAAVCRVVDELRNGPAAGTSTAAAATPPPAGAVALTRFTAGLGCACKLRPQSLEEILAGLPRPADPALLVGTETRDDAAVYRLDAQTAIIETVDFFTPIVDNPYVFGAIAAANALSDIYAMGGTPLFALNLVAFPAARLPLASLGEILRGAADTCREAGIDIAGGHSIDDTEPKFGLAVTGRVHPDKIWRNIGAQPGDALLLTKPLGLGILTTAMKRGMLGGEEIATAIAVMRELNRAAAAAAAGHAVHACTDITGFGLLGHLFEMTRGSNVEAEIRWQEVPLLAGAWEMAAAGAVPGGTRANLDHAAPHATFAAEVPEIARLLLADAQTSGGLLLAVPAATAPDLLKLVQKECRGPVAIIGAITGPGQGR